MEKVNNALTAGSSNSASTTLNIPTTLSPGMYYLGTIADYTNVQVESNETNNTLTGNTLNITPGADLVMSALSSPQNAVTGNLLAITDTVTNQGTTTSAGFSIRYYLSTDATITTSDIVLGTRSVSSLAATAADSATTNVTIPYTLIPGTYYLGAIADYNNTRAETNENNNALTGNTIALTVGADLIISSVSSPATAPRGTSVSVNNTVANQGSGSTENFYVGIYLSTDQTITTTDRFLGNRYIGSIASGAANTAATMVTIPLSISPGTYYVGAIADYPNKALENNKNNNSLAGNTITIH